MSGDRVKARFPNAAAAAALLVTGGALAPALAAQDDLAPLGRLEAGLYELRDLDRAGRFAPVCLGDRSALVQLQHRRTGCSRQVVTRAQDSIEVRYSCPGGFGQTAIRVETPRLARIETQGVDKGVPFGFRAEARRVGACRSQS